MITTFAFNNNMAGSQQNITTALTGATDTQATLTAVTATLCRSQVIDFSFGITGAPNSTDCTVVYDVIRCTTVGTGTAATPVSPDNAAGVTRNVATVNQTAAPTVSTGIVMYYAGFNQRASQRIVLRDDEFLIGPATNTAGFAFRSASATYASTVGWQIYFQDLN
jgi:hypothetical protein